MTFLSLQDRLRELIRARVRRGELTGSGLARAAGFPQGHLSNFLNQRRGLSLESMDRLLNTLHIDTLDLIGAAQIEQRAPRRRAIDDVERISLVAAEHAAQARFTSRQVLQTQGFSRSFLQRLKPSHDHDRDDWQRFVLLKLELANARQIVSLEMTSATLLVDRHYIALEPYRRRQPNLYAVRFGANCVAGYLSFVGSNLVLRTGDLRAELHDLPIAPGRSYSQYVIGRVCHVGLEI